MASQGLIVRRGERLVEGALKLLDHPVIHLAAEGVAELFGIQYEGHRERFGIELQLLDGVVARQLAGRQQIGAARHQHLQPLAQPVGGDDTVLVHAAVEQQLLGGIGAHGTDAVVVDLLDRTQGNGAALVGQQHVLGVADGAGPLEQGIAGVGAGGGEEHHVGFLGEQVVTPRPGQDADGLGGRLGVLPDALQQLHREASGLAGGIGEVVGGILLGQVLQLAELGLRRAKA